MATRGADASEGQALRARFAGLYRRVGGSMFRAAFSITGDRAVAEDLVQEAFASVLGRDAPEQLENPEGYLYRTARNLALDHVRRTQRQERARERVAVVEASDPSDRSQAEDAERLSRALAELPFPQREVVLLHVYDGLPFPEVARRVGAPLGTVHSRFRYAMERMRSSLGGRDAR